MLKFKDDNSAKGRGKIGRKALSVLLSVALCMSLTPFAFATEPEPAPADAAGTESLEIPATPESDATESVSDVVVLNGNGIQGTGSDVSGNAKSGGTVAGDAEEVPVPALVMSGDSGADAASAAPVRKAAARGLISGEQFYVTVVKVVNGQKADSVRLTAKCLQSTGHSGYNHSTNLRSLANQSGFSGYKGYNWSKYTTVPSSYTSGLCPNNNYASVHYNITGSAPYKANETLFLFYEDLKTFTLKYNANGGTGAPATQTQKASGSSYSFTVSGTVPTKSGHRFLGWSTSAAATSPSYYAGSSINVTGTTTLYAVWQKTETKVTLSYDANGGSNAPSAQTVDKGTSVSVKGKGSMNRAGYDFLGWSADAHATVADWAEGDTMRLNENSTLYAVWKLKPVEKVTLIYDANGGINPPAGRTVDKGTEITVRSKANMTYEGHEFLGWALDADATEPEIMPGDGITPDENLTLYAVWKKNVTEPGVTMGTFTVVKSFTGLEDGTEPPSVTLTYSAYRTKDGARVGNMELGNINLSKQDGGTYKGVISPTVWNIGTSSGQNNYLPENERSRYKNVVEINEVLSTAAVTGHTHDRFGAKYAADGRNDGPDTVRFVMDGATFQKILNVKNVYTAVPDPKVTVTWVDGYTDAPIKTETVKKNISDDELDALYPAEPSREGYVFDGWGTPTRDGDGNITITAQWKKDRNGNNVPDEQEYRTVTYTDGTDDATVFADQVTDKLLDGDATPVFGDGTVPVRNGYVFKGWTPAVSETVNGSAVYTATWGEDKNGNGTDDADEERFTVTYTDGADDDVVFEDQVTTGILSGMQTPDFVDEEGNVAVPTRDGYTFNGWNPEVSDTVTGNAVYAAQWTPDVPIPTPEPTPTPGTDEPDPVPIPGPGTPIPTPAPTPNPGTTPGATNNATNVGTSTADGGNNANADSTGTTETAIADEPVPMASPEEVSDDPTPLSDGHGRDCWVHWLIILGIIVTLVYFACVIVRRKRFTDVLVGQEDDVIEAWKNDKEATNA